MNRIENPTPETSMPRPSTLRRLDTGLQWAPGSASRCLDMRAPEPLEDLVADSGPFLPPVTSTAPDKPFSLPTAAVPAGATDAVVSLDIETVTVPMEVFNQFFAVYDAYQTGALEGDSLDDALAVVAQLLGAAHATELLERMGGPGRQVPSFLTLSLSRYLDPHAFVVAPSGARIALTDQSYRRWLAGFKVADDGDVYRRRWVTKMRGISQ
ncbi:hypothetical protein AXK57_21940 [Tsukamurella pulmonis]|uniref:hypothetical protein n=1 Tax=Tsukamurella pulmonis TaxID=47312 RepID=UPI0007966428|nr:hypothetical protein [Tsukamurella pulmonis]KXP11605.1 hypothetical protein AXK57_21940 [Tsukamurella pulmonis]